MLTHVEEILQTYELLAEGEKREVASEILRRSLSLDSPTLSDEQLVGIAEGLFLELDKQAVGGRSRGD